MNCRTIALALACLVCVACPRSEPPKNDAGSATAVEAGTGGTRATTATGTGGAGAGGAADGGSEASGGTGVSSGCTAKCPANEHCELVAVQCIRAPCPAQPTCVPDQTPPSKVSCDPRKILCKRAAPSCGQFQVPSVEGSCYGPCVSIESCPCTGPEECPDSNQYTCHMSAKHCTPYL